MGRWYYPLDFLHVSGDEENPWWDPAGDGLCVWSAYQPKGAASLAVSYTDLSGNGNNAGVGVAPTWDVVNGWKFNGINQYLTTTFVPQNDQSQSILIQFTNRTNTGMLASMTSGANTRFGIYLNAGGNVQQYHNGSVTQNNPCAAAGNAGVAGNQGYRDGIADAGAIAAFSGPATHALYIGARNNAGVVDLFNAVYIQALVIYDCVLTAPQVLAVVTAMAAL